MGVFHDDRGVSHGQSLSPCKAGDSRGPEGRPPDNIGDLSL
jgi:hypothetical protein